MFKCKVCAEKDSRIADLKEQLSTLRTLVLPDNSAQATPLTTIEADAVLNGTQHIIEIDETIPHPTADSDAEIEERDRILAATY